MATGRGNKKNVKKSVKKIFVHDIALNDIVWIKLRGFHMWPRQVNKWTFCSYISFLHHKISLLFTVLNKIH